MSQKPTQDLLWTGEHWILYLRKPTEQINSVSISLYKTYYSLAGEGTVALVESQSNYKPTLLTDNRLLANFITENIISWKTSPFQNNIPIDNATFIRKGDIRIDPEWQIYTKNQTITAKWLNLEAPLIVNTPKVTHSLLTFCKNAIVTINGNKLDGKIYNRKDWIPVTGKPESSSCFALAETMVL